MANAGFIEGMRRSIGGWRERRLSESREKKVAREARAAAQEARDSGAEPSGQDELLRYYFLTHLNGSCQDDPGVGLHHFVHSVLDGGGDGSGAGPS